MSDDERVHYEVTVEGADTPRLKDFSLTEAISRPYELGVTLAVPPDTDLGGLLGQDLVLTIQRADLEERVAGLCTEVRVAGEDNESDTHSLLLRLRVEPALSMLALNRNSRVFQDKTVEEIVQAVLDEALEPYGRSAEFSLEGSYEPHEYCVQYEESDLDFVHRMLEEEGIHYQFDHTGEQEKLQLGDANGAFADIGTVRFIPGGGASNHEESVRFFRPARRAATTHVQLRDWNFLSASEPFGDEDGAEDPDYPGERRLYDHGIDRKLTAALLKTRAGVRIEAHRIRGASRSGVAQCIVMRAGKIFELNGSPTLGADGTYLITEVVHEMNAISRAEGFAGEPYASRFACAPSDLPFRPARSTKKPIIEGVELAKVTGPAGEEIHPDEHGRVKVLFPWDRDGAEDETSSCWVRAEQPWAGDGWGWMFIPRIGMEVVVQFVDGNPDRPLITGCVYNGENLPPYPLPDEKTKSTFKTNSSLGGGGFNEFRFDDKAGKEEIFIHAQKDFDEVVLNNHTTEVTNDQTNTVDGCQVQDVGADQEETIDKTQNLTVDGHRKVHVKTNYTETIDGGELRLVFGGSDETYKSTETRVVLGGITEVIIGGDKHKVTGAKTELLIGGQTQIVVGAMLEDITGGASNTTAGGMINVLTPSAGNWDAGGTMTMKGGAMCNIIGPPEIKYTGPVYSEEVTTLVKLGALNFSATGSSIGTVGISIGITGASAAVTRLSIGYTIMALGVTGSAHGLGGPSLTFTGLKLNAFGVTEFKNALDTTL